MSIVKSKTYHMCKLYFRELTSLTKVQYILPDEIFKVINWLRHSSFEIIDKERELAEQSKPYMVYVRWQQAEFTKTLQHLVSRTGLMPRDRQSHSELNQRMLTGIQRFSSVGNTSTIADTYILDDLTKKPLILLASQHIFIDIDTRKPIPFDDRFREVVNSHKFNVTTAQREIFDQCKTYYEIPRNVKTYVKSSCIDVHQMDYNNHANQGAYIELCFDCIGEAVSKGFCSNMTETILKYPVRRYSTLFIKESLLGDIVDTMVWQDVKNPWVFHFHVMKNNQAICQLQFEFYDPADLDSDVISKL